MLSINWEDFDKISPSDKTIRSAFDKVDKCSFDKSFKQSFKTETQRRSIQKIENETPISFSVKSESKSDIMKLDDIKVEIKPYPIPDKLTISTRTALASLNITMNPTLIASYINLIDRNDSTAYPGIIDAKINTFIRGKIPIIKKTRTNNKEKGGFNNSQFVNVGLSEDNIINVKIFNNGRLQLTGVKKEEDGFHACSIVCQEIYNLFERMITFNTVISELKKVQRIRNLKKLMMKELKTKYRKVYLPNGLSDHIMITELGVFNDSLQRIDVPNDIRKQMELKCACNKELRNRRIIIRLKPVLKAEPVLKRCIKKDFIPYNFVPDLNSMILSDYEISMYNTTYNAKFKIDRTSLYNLLKQTYNIFVVYKPNKYPGINMKYMLGEYSKDGVCTCPSKFVSKKDDKYKCKRCMTVSILIFKTGKIIITGGKDLHSTNSAYNFINSVLEENYDQIVSVALKDYIDI